MEEEFRKNIESIGKRRQKLRDILRDRGLVDEGCECGFWRSEHDDIGPSIGHGRCLLSDCPKFRLNPKMKLKIGQETRGLFHPGMSEVQLIKKPCPYPRCGSEKITVMHSESFYADHPERPIRYHVQCKECGTRGPMEHEELFAIQAWNDMPRIDNLVSEEE